MIGRRYDRIRSFAQSAGARDLIAGSSWSLIAQVTSKAAVLIAMFAAARALGPNEFGVFVGFQAIVLLATGLWDLGFATMGARREAAGEWTSSEMAASCVRGRLILIPLFLAVVVVGSAFVDTDGWSGKALGLVLLAAGGISNGLSAISLASLNARLRFRDSTIATIAGRLTMAAGAMTILLVDPSQTFAALSATYLLGEIVTMMAAARYSGQFLIESMPIRVGIGWPAFVHDIRKSVALAASSILILVYNRLDVVIVAALASAIEAGYYAPASRIQDAMLILPGVAIAGLTPVAARRFGTQEDYEAVGHTLVVSVVMSLALTIPATVLAYLLTPWLITNLLGAAFDNSIEPARILLLSLPFIAVGSPVMSALIAIDRAPLTTLMIGVGFVVAMIGMFVLVPRYGADGGAWASMIREPAIVITGLTAYVSISHRSGH